jgi:hypothetical protein
MVAEDEGCSIGGWSGELDLRADEYAILDVVSSPGEAEYVSWTCHHRIRNRRRDWPLYTVGKRVLSHRTSERRVGKQQIEEYGDWDAYHLALAAGETGSPSLEGICALGVSVVG